MKRIFSLFLPLLFMMISSCSSKGKEAQIMRMNGYVENVSNEEDIRCNKGDTIILSTCGWKGDFKTSIYGIYTGTIQETLVWYNKDGSIKTTCRFEKVVFLRNINE